MDTTERLVLISCEQDVTRVTLNRPEALNALNQPMIQQLYEAFAALTDDAATRVVILEGAGGSFCAGADLTLLGALPTEEESYALLQSIKRLVEMMRAIPPPLICKLEGVAYGGGANLALACDLVVAAETARICEVFSAIGLNLDVGGTFTLPRLIGLSQARALALLGNEISGRAAAELGLVYKATPAASLEDEVMALARALAQKSAQALTAIKHGLDSSFEMSLSEALEWEARQQSVLLGRPEIKAAAERFIQSRAKKAQG